jgi:hypothetical protein
MKKDKGNRCKWIHLRVSPQEHELLQQWVNKTTHLRISELTRDILFHRPIHVLYRSESADDFILVVLELKKELKSIGTNLNQAVKRLHTFQSINDLDAYIFSVERNAEIVRLRIDEILNNLHKTYQHFLTRDSGSNPNFIGPLLPDSNQAAAADEQGNKSGQ